MARLPFPAKSITGVYGSMSDFRRKNKMQAHSGTDFAPAGSNKGKTAIPAVADGTVKLVQWSNVLGWVLVQSVYDVKKKKTAYVGYCHLKDEPTLKVGAKLKEGDSIGVMGTTGSASSGIHLHLTISWTVKGVFGATADKFDFVEWIKTQEAPATKGATKETPAKPKAPAAKKTCPTCGQETK
jgi:murein DD-endopeptidase MepM/ murein hydrolase activator NlpD